MALRRNIPAYQELDKLVMEGRAQLVATPTADTGTVPTIVATQAKEVAIITKIFATLLPSNDTSPGLSDSGSIHTFALYDENGDVTGEKMIFISHQLVDSAFYGTVAADSSPFTQAATYRYASAPPCNPLSWDLEQPIVVPPLHTLRSLQDGAVTMSGGNFMARGYITDEETARMLGFGTGSQDATYKVDTGGVVTSTFIKNMSGFRGGALSATDIVTVVPSLAGHAVQIIDLNVRVQTLSNANTARSAQLIMTTDSITGAGLALTTGANVFAVANNNHSELAQIQAAPCLYLPSGNGLFLATASDARCSCSVTYRYVPTADVPEGVWWGYASTGTASGNRVEITPPGANTNTVGTSSLYTDGSTTLTLYYPGKASKSRSVTTATTPGTGFQHVVEGYAISVQKGNTVASDRAYFAITTGASDGNIGISGGGLTTTNNLISPIMCVGAHNQNLTLAEDGLNIPCLKDTGAIKLEITGRGAASSTPATNDLDISSFHCLVWGRTIPSNYGTGHFKGGAS